MNKKNAFQGLQMNTKILSKEEIINHLNTELSANGFSFFIEDYGNLLVIRNEKISYYKEKPLRKVKKLRDLEFLVNQLKENFNLLIKK